MSKTILIGFSEGYDEDTCRMTLKGLDGFYADVSTEDGRTATGYVRVTEAGVQVGDDLYDVVASFPWNDVASVVIA